jgi:restriction endonuclease S subunit
MKQILSALLDLSASQAATLESLDERLSAFEKTWLFYHSEREEDLNNHLEDEHRARRESAARL